MLSLHYHQSPALYTLALFLCTCFQYGCLFAFTILCGYLVGYLATRLWYVAQLWQTVWQQIEELEQQRATIERMQQELTQLEQEFAQRRQARLAAMDAEDSEADTVSE
jgi:hypothetical protein